MEGARGNPERERKRETCREREEKSQSETESRDARSTREGTRERERKRKRERKGGYSRRELLTVHCLYEPPESRHIPCPPSCLSLPRQIAYDVPLMKRSTKPASPSSDSGRRDSSKRRERGEGKVQGSHTSRVSTGCGIITDACIGINDRERFSFSQKTDNDILLLVLPLSVSLVRDFHRLGRVKIRGLQGYRLGQAR